MGKMMGMSRILVWLMRKQFQRGEGEGKKDYLSLVLPDSPLRKLEMIHSSCSSLFSRSCSQREKLRCPLHSVEPWGFLQGEVLRWTSRSPAESSLRKWYLQNEQAHLISGLFPGKFQVFLRSIWCMAPAVNMCAAGDCWGSHRHISELRERVIWSQTIWISAGHWVLHDMAYYKLTSSTTCVSSLMCH